MDSATCVGCSKQFQKASPHQIYCSQPACQKLRKDKNRKNSKMRLAGKPAKQESVVIRTNNIECKSHVVNRPTERVNITHAVALPKDNRDERLELLQKENAELKNQVVELKNKYISLHGAYCVARERGDI